MPNHVRNVVKFKNLTQEQVYSILTLITHMKSDDPLGADTHIDFNKIIPQPRTKAECPEEYLLTPESHVMADEDKPWLDWYKWQVDNWGTKWNAYDGYVIIKKSSVQFVFSTAWSIPVPIYTQMAKMFKNVNIEMKWADEDLGSNCGAAVHIAGCDGWEVTHEDSLRNPREFARRLWDKY